MKFHKNGAAPSVLDIFVFGSNEAGRHGKGAALFARENYGAEYGNPEGFQGHSYAIPTKNKDIQTLPLHKISQYVDSFISYVLAHPNKKFFITAIGTGYAGYDHEDIAPMFKKLNGVNNVNLPQEWEKYIVK